MKNIMFFGDSNTFGSHPLGGRHPYEERFTGLVQRALGPEYRVIEEGCGGRTTVFEDEIETGRNGRAALPTCIASHNPLDLIVVMLGTNDLKARFNATPWDLGKAMHQILRIIDVYPYAPYYSKPSVLLVSPIEIGDGVESGPFGCFTEEAAAKSRLFPGIYSKVAKEAGVFYLNAASVARPSQTDHLHMDKESHAALAKAMTARILEILG